MQLFVHLYIFGGCLVEINNWFAALCMIVLYVVSFVVGYSVYLSNRDAFARAEKQRGYRSPKKPPVRLFAVSGVAAGLVVFMVSCGLVLVLSKAVADTTRISSDRVSDVYALSLYTDIQPNDTKKRLIGNIVNGSIVEANAQGQHFSLQVKPDLSLVTDVVVGDEVTHKLVTIPADKVRFSLTAPDGQFYTTFAFVSSKTSGSVFVRERDIVTERCRLALVNLALASHCTDVSSVVEQALPGSDKVIDNLQSYIDWTVAHVEVAVSPADYARLFGAGE